MPTAPAPPSQTKPEPFMSWHRRLLGLCLMIAAFSLGIILVVFPWLRDWDLNWIAVHSQRFSDIWMSRYFRGALSGLGLLNIYIALSEFVTQLKSIFRQS